MINLFFLYLYRVINFLTLPNYYYYNDGILIDISLIVYLLNFLLIGFFINSYLFEDNIYCVKTNKVWIYSKNIKNKLSLKIIKNITYNDNFICIILDEFKKNIYNIDNNIELVFLLKLFYKIKINKKSFIKINYYNCKSKLINITYKTKLNEVFT
jgi:hypothetical protein